MLRFFSAVRINRVTIESPKANTEIITYDPSQLMIRSRGILGQMLAEPACCIIICKAGATFGKSALNLLINGTSAL